MLNIIFWKESLKLNFNAVSLFYVQFLQHFSYHIYIEVSIHEYAVRLAKAPLLTLACTWSFFIPISSVSLISVFGYPLVF